MKSANKKRWERIESGIDKIMEGKRLTKPEAGALAIYACIEWGSHPGQYLEGSFPEAYGYLPGIDAALLSDSRNVDWMGVKPSKIDEINHKMFSEMANSFYWKQRERFLG